jgi:two-component system sensor histidine kinase SenX3
VRNQAAVSFRSTKHAGVLVDEAVDVVLAAARRGEARSQTVDLFGPPRRVFDVHAAPLPDGSSLVTIEDISERARVETVRTDLVANISHELKTPVGALAVLAEALADDEDVAVMRRLSLKMVDEAHRVARTIDDLLELSRIELGGQPVHDVVGMGMVVAEAVDRARPLAEQRHIEIRLAEQPGVKAVGDRRQLVSAVANLLENAIKYSEEGTEVHLRTRVVDGWAEVVVSDHGIGIPARDIDRIFERFYRVDRARSRGTGGTGLGLAIVRHVATNHGGEVRVTSQEGEGSTFTLRLPAEDAPG